jgi:hypothetical protein
MRSISVSPGVWMYQLTDKGLALELTGKGNEVLQRRHSELSCCHKEAQKAQNQQNLFALFVLLCG